MVSLNYMASMTVMVYESIVDLKSINILIQCTWTNTMINETNEPNAALKKFFQWSIII